MAQETTTIEVTTEQAETLEDLKRDSSESYKSVLQVLIDGYSDESGDEPAVEMDVGSIMDKLESVETIAEQARDNTADIKRGMGQ